jgi:hypothetical protein
MVGLSACCIPKEYWFAYGVRLDLLATLLESDGTIDVENGLDAKDTHGTSGLHEIAVCGTQGGPNANVVAVSMTIQL